MEDRKLGIFHRIQGFNTPSRPSRPLECPHQFNDLPQDTVAAQFEADAITHSPDFSQNKFEVCTK